MDQLIKWLLQSAQGQQSKILKYVRNWPWLIAGLALLLFII